MWVQYTLQASVDERGFGINNKLRRKEGEELFTFLVGGPRRVDGISVVSDFFTERINYSFEIFSSSNTFSISVNSFFNTACFDS